MTHKVKFLTPDIAGMAATYATSQREWQDLSKEFEEVKKRLNAARNNAGVAASSLSASLNKFATSTERTFSIATPHGTVVVSLDNGVNLATPMEVESDSR